MYEFFRSKPVNLRGITNFFGIMYARNEVRKAITKYHLYYRRWVDKVDSGHLLLRLITNIGIPYDEPQRYVQKVKDRADELAMALGITSANHKGVIRSKGTFYGKRAREIVVGISEKFDVTAAVKDWQSLAPIKVLYHPINALSMPMLDGDRELTNGSDYCVISVNIPMLALQFQEWYKWMKVTYKNDPLDESHFLKMYPIPNMIESHMDIAELNRMVDAFNGRSLESFESLHSFQTPNLDSIIDYQLKKYVEYISTTKLSYQQMLSTLPAFVANNQMDNLYIPPMPVTRNNEWTLVIARMVYISFMLRVNAKTGATVNTAANNEWRRELAYYRQDRTMAAVLSGSEYNDVMSWMDRNIGAYLGGP